MTRSLIQASLALLISVPQILFAGQTIELASGTAPHHPQQPQVAIDANGAIHVVFGVGNQIRYCHSDEGGKSFGKPVDLPAVHSLSLGMRRGPRIATGDGFICVTAIGGKQGKGRDGDLLALHSKDGGKTWLGPVAVNDVPDAAREGLHAMAAGAKGKLCSVWLDLRNRKTEVMASTSADGGASWDKNVLVYRSPDGSVCECCHPSVAFDEQGRIHVLWRNSLSGARDMYAATSTDGGKSFGDASKLGEGTWPLEACPMDGGAIAAVKMGQMASTWRRDKSIFLTMTGQAKEHRLGAGEQPWIAGSTDGPVVVWLKKRGDVAYLLSPGSHTPTELARHAYDPVVVSAPTGRGPIVAAWESRAGKKSAIYLQVVEAGRQRDKPDGR